MTEYPPYSIDDVYQQVRDSLRSYAENGLIDESRLDRWVLKALSDIGLTPSGTTEKAFTVRIPIVRGKVALPEGLTEINEVWLETTHHSHPLYPVGYEPSHDYPFGYPVTPSSQLSAYLHPHITPAGLALPERHPHMDSYKREGNFLHVHPDKGVVKLVYQGLTDGASFIPGDPDITDYVIKSLVYLQVNDWYLNDEVPNLQQKLGETKVQYQVAYAQAHWYVKLPTFQQLYHYKRHRKPRLLR